MKSKAASLAQAGELVTFIFLGGSGKTEAVMSIANKLDFDPTITVLSQQDLEEMHPWRPWTPSPLSLLKFFIEKEKPQHVMVDEHPDPGRANLRSIFFSAVFFGTMMFLRGSLLPQGLTSSSQAWSP